MKSNWRAAIIALVVVLVLVGGAGWYLAIMRASELAVARNTLQTDDASVASIGHDKEALQQTVNNLQAQLATAQRSADQAQAALATAKGEAEDEATLRTQLADANARAAATAAQLQALKHKQATKTSTKEIPSRVAPVTFDLPRSASTHQYLVAAKQAIGSGNLAKARAALGRAEVRSLNTAQLNGPPSSEQQERSHTIQQAIDMLDAGKKASALDTITTLLAESAQPPPPQ